MLKFPDVRITKNTIRPSLFQTELNLEALSSCEDRPRPLLSTSGPPQQGPGPEAAPTPHPLPSHPSQTGSGRQEWALARARGQQVSTGYFWRDCGDIISFNYSGIILTWLNYFLKTIRQTSRCSYRSQLPPPIGLRPGAELGWTSLPVAWLFFSTSF